MPKRKEAGDGGEPKVKRGQTANSQEGPELKRKEAGDGGEPKVKRGQTANSREGPEHEISALI